MMLLQFSFFCLIFIFSYPLDGTADSKNPCQPKLNAYYTFMNTDNQNLGASEPDFKSTSITKGAVNDYKKWYFKQHEINETTFYTIRNKFNNLALGISKDANSDNVTYELSTYDKKPEQHFYWNLVRDDCKIIGYPRMYLIGANSNETKEGTIKNTWKLDEQMCDPYPGQNYRLVHVLSKRGIGVGQKMMQIVAAANGNTYPKMVLQCMDDELEDFSLFQFVLIANSKIMYYIYIKNMSKVVDVWSDNLTKGGKVIQFDRGINQNQHFSLHPSFSNGSSCLIKGIQSQRFLAPLKIQGVYKSGSDIIINEETETEDELWHLEPYGVPVEYISTIPPPMPTPPPSKSSITAPGQINMGECLWSPNREYFACMQTDGNFVVYEQNPNPRPVWHTNTNTGLGPTYRLIMQADNNLVLTQSEPLSSARWNANIRDKTRGPSTMVLQDDGNLVVHNAAGQTLWSWKKGLNEK